MKQIRNLTRSSMVLLAMYRAAGGGTSRVPYEDLVLQAWRDYPSVFSLRNHPEHPDASDIHKKLYQSLKSNGYVVPLGNKCFRLTEDGVAKARDLEQVSMSSPSMPTRLSRDQEAFIHHARLTRAFGAWMDGHKENLIDHDARLFFRYGVSTPFKERQHRVTLAERAIERGCTLSIPDGEALRNLAAFLKTKFLSKGK